MGQLVQVIQTAIGNLGVNTSDFPFRLGPVFTPQFFLGEFSLSLGKLFGVFQGMAGITGFKTIRGDEQILDANINANLFISNGQQGRLKFTQARHEVPA